MPTLDVLSYSGDLKIKTGPGDTMTLDTGVQTGTVVITGNLNVLGKTVNISATNTNLIDNILVLNAGEVNSYVTLGQSGIAIDRGNAASSTSSARFLYDDTKYWSTTGTSTASYRGVWGISVGSQGSALELAAIRLAANSPNDALGRRSLNLLGQGTASVLSVAGQSNYASRVTDKDDIPNKEYVDNRPFAGTATNALTAFRLDRGDTSVVLFDNSIDGGTSRISLTVDSQQSMSIANNSVVLQGIAFIGNTIRPVAINNNLILQTLGTGTVSVNNGLSISTSVIPQATQGMVKIYNTSTLGAGSTGILFKTVDTTAAPPVEVSGELISARKALVLSIIF